MLLFWNTFSLFFQGPLKVLKEHDKEVGTILCFYDLFISNYFTIGLYLFVCIDRLLPTQAKETWPRANHVFLLLFISRWRLDMLECMLTFAPSAKTQGEENMPSANHIF